MYYLEDNQIWQHCKKQYEQAQSIFQIMYKVPLASSKNAALVEGVHVRHH